MKRNKQFEMYTSKEIAEALIVPGRLTTKRQEKAKADLAAARAKVQAGLTEKDRLESKLLQFKLKLNDYLKSEDFDPTKTFGYFLSQYIALANRRRKVFASEIDIKESELSQMINSHRDPPEYLIVRLEIHSNKTIPAEKWLGLVEKERVYTLRTNKDLRKREKGHVSRRLEVSI